MKPFYRVKGKFKDGRNKLVIEYNQDGKRKSKALPKPEEMLGRLKDEK